MKLDKLISSLMLLAVALPAVADWVETDIGPDGSVAFVDPATIRRDGGFARAWVLVNLAAPDRDGDLSITGYKEYDCERKRSRVLKEDYFPMRYAQGTSRTAPASPSWTYHEPATLGMTRLNFVCSRAGLNTREVGQLPPHEGARNQAERFQETTW